MRQTGITILATALPEQVGKLTTMLSQLGHDPAELERRLRLSTLKTLHYASVSLIPGVGGDTLVIFEGNIDGSAESFLDELVRTSPGAVDEIFSHCRDYPRANPDGARRHEDVVTYLRRHNVGPGTFFVAWPGMSVDDIRREDMLRRRIQAFLDEPAQEKLRELSVGEVHRQVVAAMRADPDLEWAFEREEKRSAGWVRKLALGLGGIGLSTLAIVGLVRSGQVRAGGTVVLLSIAGLLVIVAGVAVRLRLAERADDRAEQARKEPWQITYARWVENLSTVRHQEDTRNQNHMSTVADIKPGRFRRFMLNVVLAVVRLGVRFSTPGSLSGISSIHFARWVVTPDRKQLIFFSNFDGSWESYLGDFIELAAGGLTGIWTNSTNAVGFPRTKWLIKQGAKDEPRFKAFARYGTVPTLVWYSAYPQLSIPNIANNQAIRAGLHQDLDGDAAAAWLRRL